MEPFIDPNVESIHYKRIKEYIRKYICEDFETIDSDEFMYKLESFKTKRNKPLSYESKKLFLSTVKKYNQDVRDNAMLVFEYSGSYSINKNEAKALNKTILYFIQNHFINNKIHDKNYFVGVAIYLTLCTNLRISELFQLRQSDIICMINKIPIDIRIKKRHKQTTILCNIELLKLFKRNYTHISKYILQDNISQSYINLKIRNHMHKLIETSSTFGIQAIRKLNTSLILEHTGNINLATTFNRHRHRDTTYKYYNTDAYREYILNNAYKIP